MNMENKFQTNGPSDLAMDSILEYLVVLEKKLPKRVYSLYRSTISPGTVVTEELMNEEARRIMEFLGLTNFGVEVKFESLGGPAGMTIPGGVDGVIPIKVDPDFSDLKTVMATLAHELCHTLIHVNYIRPSFTWMTEIYTDLATLISGLGELTIGGCATTLRDGQSCALGYLTASNYTKVYHLINTLKGYSGGTIGVMGDESIADLINVWKSAGPKGAQRSAFERDGKGLAELHRNIQEIKNLLLIYEQDAKDAQSQLSETFVDSPEAEPFRAFRSLYLSRNRAKNSWSSEVIEKTLYNLYTTLAKKRETRLPSAIQYTCPKCSRVHTIELDGSGTRILRCRCGFTFSATRDGWSPSQVEYRLAQERDALGKAQLQHDEEVISTFVASLPKWMQKLIMLSTYKK